MTNIRFRVLVGTALGFALFLYGLSFTLYAFIPSTPSPHLNDQDVIESGCRRQTQKWIERSSLWSLLQMDGEDTESALECLTSPPQGNKPETPSEGTKIL